MTSNERWPADNVERRPIASLAPYARNARTHSLEQIDQIAASIREWGWTIPILVDESGGLIAGHARLLAAQKLDLVDVPVMVAAGWSEAQKRAYVLADNKLALNAGWDDGLLRIEISDIASLGLNIDLLGFSSEELAALANAAAVGNTDPDEAPKAPDSPVSAFGDVWLLGKHRLVCGDCTDSLVVDKALNGVKPHLMVTDPPYGIEYDAAWRVGIHGKMGGVRSFGKVDNDERAEWGAAWSLFAGDVAYVWCASLHNDIAITSLEECGFARRSQIIWVKQHFAISRGDYHWQHEPCWYAVRKSAKGHWAGDRKQTTVWQISSMNAMGHNTDAGNEWSGHSTQKPVECMKRPGKPENAAFYCQHCDSLVDERHKATMVSDGEWRATNQDAKGHAGFRISALVSLFANASWGLLAQEYLKAKRAGPVELQVFANTVEGRVWKTSLDALDETALMQRAEPFSLSRIPGEVLAITAGVDVQNDRLEVTVLGWSQTTPFVLGHTVIWGSTLDDTTWAELDELLRSQWVHPRGWRMRIDAAAVDTGGTGTGPESRTQQVYNFCAPRISRRIYAIKGQGGPQRIWRPSRTKGGGVRLFIVGVDQLKAEIMERLAAEPFVDSMGSPCAGNAGCGSAIQTRIISAFQRKTRGSPKPGASGRCRLWSKSGACSPSCRTPPRSTGATVP